MLRQLIAMNTPFWTIKLLRVLVCLSIVPIFFVLLLLSPPTARGEDEEFYTVLAASYGSLEYAEQDFQVLLDTFPQRDLDYLRIELVGGYYTIRIGKYDGIAQAENLRQLLLQRFRQARVLSAYIKPERIVKFLGKEGEGENLILKGRGGDTIEVVHSDLKERAQYKAYTDIPSGYVAEIENRIFYTVQLASFSQEKFAADEFASIVQRYSPPVTDWLRVEQVQKYYTIRVGKYAVRQDAERVFEALVGEYSQADLFKVRIRPDRVSKVFLPRIQPRAAVVGDSTQAPAERTDMEEDLVPPDSEHEALGEQGAVSVKMSAATAPTPIPTLVAHKTKKKRGLTSDESAINDEAAGRSAKDFGSKLVGVSGKDENLPSNNHSGLENKSSETAQFSGELKRDTVTRQESRAEFFTIQVASFSEMALANLEFDTILSRFNKNELDRLRIEFVNGFFTIRIGQLDTKIAAEKKLAVFRSRYKNAAIIYAYIIPSRIQKSIATMEAEAHLEKEQNESAPPPAERAEASATPADIDMIPIIATSDSKDDVQEREWPLGDDSEQKIGEGGVATGANAAGVIPVESKGSPVPDQEAETTPEPAATIASPEVISDTDHVQSATILEDERGIPREEGGAENEAERASEFDKDGTGSGLAEVDMSFLDELVDEAGAEGVGRGTEKALQTPTSGEQKRDERGASSKREQSGAEEETSAAPVKKKKADEVKFTYEVVTVLDKDDRGENIRMPSALFFDNATDELYLINGVNNRIIVFGPDYFPQNSLGKGRGLDSPLSGAIDPSGKVYITQAGTPGTSTRLTILNSAFLPEREITPADIPDSQDFIFQKIALAPNGLIYLTGINADKVLVLNPDGTFKKWFKLAIDKKGNYAYSDGSEPELTTQIKDVITDSLGNLFFLSEDTSKIYVFSPDEEFLFSFGTKGGAEGKLSRPRGIVIDEQKRCFYVVDYMRHTVLMYDYTGKYRFEFGGRGWGVEWFNYPVDIELGRQGQVIVADFFNQRVQVFEIRNLEQFPERPAELWSVSGN